MVVAPVAPPPVRGRAVWVSPAPEEISASAVGKNLREVAPKARRRVGGRKGERGPEQNLVVRCVGSPHGEGPQAEGRLLEYPGSPQHRGFPRFGQLWGSRGSWSGKGKAPSRIWGSGAGLGWIHRCQSHRSESWDLGKGKGEPLLPAANLHFPRLSLWDFHVLHRWGGSSRRKGGIGALLVGRAGLCTMLRT